MWMSKETRACETFASIVALNFCLTAISSLLEYVGMGNWTFDGRRSFCDINEIFSSYIKFVILEIYIILPLDNSIGDYDGT